MDRVPSAAGTSPGARRRAVPAGGSPCRRRERPVENCMGVQACLQEGSPGRTRTPLPVSYDDQRPAVEQPFWQQGGAGEALLPQHSLRRRPVTSQSGSRDPSGAIPAPRGREPGLHSRASVSPSVGRAGPVGRVARCAAGLPSDPAAQDGAATAPPIRTAASRAVRVTEPDIVAFLSRPEVSERRPGIHPRQNRVRRDCAGDRGLPVRTRQRAPDANDRGEKLRQGRGAAGSAGEERRGTAGPPLPRAAALAD